tara:strand:- start:1104 stop:1286 length:183 start_codon:yes stop_codon:yes gene_type:complete
MEVFDPAFHNLSVSGIKPLISLLIISIVGSFFLGALVTAVKRGIKEEGWFNLKKGKEEED